MASAEREQRALEVLDEPSPSSATSGQTPISRSNAWPTVGTIATVATTSTPPGTRQPRAQQQHARRRANAAVKSSPTSSW